MKKVIQIGKVVFYPASTNLGCTGLRIGEVFYCDIFTYRHYGVTRYGLYMRYKNIRHWVTIGKIVDAVKRAFHKN